MCWLKRGNTVEEIVANNSVGMSDSQKAQYWYELSQNIFAILGKVDVLTFPLTNDEWKWVALAQYPTLTDLKMAGLSFITTDLSGLQEILSRDWTNLIPYTVPTHTCAYFGTDLYEHLVLYYGINAIIPVWGDTSEGYHGFNLAVVKDGGKFIARLIEPQTDAIFIDQGPMGKYVPRIAAMELGIKR